MRDFSEEAELDRLAATLGPVVARARALELPCLLIGAAGRDLILHHARGWPRGRATYDVDVAVRVPSWRRYEELRRELEEREGARPTSSAKQRLVFPEGRALDLVPFGPVEEDGEIAWPPDGDPRLCTQGLQESLDQSSTVLLPGNIETRTPSVACFVVLKILAWRDRHVRLPRHDAVDLAQVLGHADRLWALEELYDRHATRMEHNEFDPALAALEVLGANLAEVLGGATRRAVADVLVAETDVDGRLELVRELGIGVDWMRRLRALRRGLEEDPPER